MIQTQHAPATFIAQDPIQTINTYHAYLKKRFGARVQKIAIDAGFSCPNRDAQMGTGGCIYCNNKVFSPAFRSREKNRSVTEQLDEAIPKFKSRYRTNRFIAYFQPFTNTYAPVEKLESLFMEALNHPDVIGISVGTRPDCVNQDKLDLFGRLAERGYISIEYGCESVYDKTLTWIRRGHTFHQLKQAVNKTSQYPVEMCLHVILGFPTETREEILESAAILSRLPVHRIKLHHLHIVENTPLADMYRDNPFPVFSLDEYVQLTADYLERLSPAIMVERLCGESPPDMTIAPKWHVKSSEMFDRVRHELKERNTFHGYLFR
jgi:uncharacterized protein